MRHKIETAVELLGDTRTTLPDRNCRSHFDESLESIDPNQNPDPHSLTPIGGHETNHDPEQALGLLQMASAAMQIGATEHR